MVVALLLLAHLWACMQAMTIAMAFKSPGHRLWEVIQGKAGQGELPGLWAVYASMRPLVVEKCRTNR